MEHVPFRDLPGQRERFAAIRLRLVLAESELRSARLALQEYVDEKRRYEMEQELSKTDEHTPLLDDTKF